MLGHLGGLGRRSVCRHQQHRDPRPLSVGQRRPQHPGGRAGEGGGGLAGAPWPAAASCRALPGLGRGTSGTWARGGPRADSGSTLPATPPQRISRAVEHAAPWLILAGSGGIADVLAAFVNQPHLLVPQAVEKQFKEKFPGERLCWEDVMHWTQLVGAPRRTRPPSRVGRSRGKVLLGVSVPPVHEEGPSLLPSPTKPPSPLWLQAPGLPPAPRATQGLCPGVPAAEHHLPPTLAHRARLRAGGLRGAGHHHPEGPDKR